MTTIGSKLRSSARPATAERLLAAAMAVIEREGPDGIRVRDISAAAGVTYSAVQFHFGGRDGLVDAAYLELYRQDLIFPTADLAGRTFADNEALQGLVTALLDAAFAPERAAARRRRAQVLGAAATRPTIAAGLAEIHREYFHAVGAVFAEPQRQGLLRPDLDAEAMGAIYLAVVNGRTLVEIGDTGLDLTAWDAAAKAAVLALVTPA